MLEWFKNIGVIVGALFAAICLLLPQVRANRPWIAAMVGIAVGLSVTLADHYLRASTGRGLQDRAACYLFPTGQACNETPQNVAPVRDDFVVTQEFLSLPQGANKDVFDTDPGSINDAKESRYCHFVIGNVGQETVVLEIGAPETDSGVTLTSLQPGERHEIKVGAISPGLWTIIDSQGRFHFGVRIDDNCR
jgi:hypothetical protein